MIDTLRGELRRLTEHAQRLDAALARAHDLPDLAAAQALVKLDKLSEQLAKVAGVLEALAEEASQPSLFKGQQTSGDGATVLSGENGGATPRRKKERSASP